MKALRLRDVGAVRQQGIRQLSHQREQVHEERIRRPALLAAELQALRRPLPAARLRLSNASPAHRSTKATGSGVSAARRV